MVITCGLRRVFLGSSACLSGPVTQVLNSKSAENEEFTCICEWRTRSRHHTRNNLVLRRTRAAADGAHAAALPASIAGMHPAGVAEAVVHGSTRSRSEAPANVPTERRDDQTLVLSASGSWCVRAQRPAHCPAFSKWCASTNLKRCHRVAGMQVSWLLLCAPSSLDAGGPIFTFATPPPG